MATIEESAVFEYCENLFRELEQRDGGYFPSKHDKVAIGQTAQRFSISEHEVNRIYGEFTKQTADIEMEKIKRLPPAMRKRVMEKKLSNILRSNKDLPFYKSESPADTEISNPLGILESEYRQMIESIAQSGWTIPLSIDIRRFGELQAIAKDNEALDQFFENFYDDKELKAICRKVRNAIPNEAQKSIFEECVNAYNANLYSVCQTTLLTVLEGFISSFGDNPEDVRVMRICRFQAEEEQKKGKKIKSLCWLSIYEYISNLFQKSNFSTDEPEDINRHWIIHGRTGKVADKIGCLRLFNALSTMASVIQNRDVLNT